LLRQQRLQFPPLLRHKIDGRLPGNRWQFWQKIGMFSQWTQRRHRSKMKSQVGKWTQVLDFFLFYIIFGPFNFWTNKLALRPPFSRLLLENYDNECRKWQYERREEKEGWHIWGPLG
jgi:hypothetical protein